MARAKSPEKRQALLDSAAREIAAVGLGVSTSRIAKGAGLAEGTIFTYFASKDDLLTELYIELKTQSHLRICSGFPHDAGLRERLRHVWVEYLRWALERPAERSVSVLSNLSLIVPAAIRDRLDAESESLTKIGAELDRVGSFRALPPGFGSSAMMAMLGTVLETAAAKPRWKPRLVEQAFEAFWRMAQ